MRHSLILLLGLLYTCGAAQAGETQPVEAPEGTPNTFNTLDVDGNGLVSRAEAAKSPDINTKFEAADANGDGALTAEEFSGLLASHDE